MLIIIKALFDTVRNIQDLLGRRIKGSIVVSLAIDHLDLNVSVVVHKILPVLLEAISRATLHKNSSVQERHEETNGEKDGKEGARRTFRIMDHVCMWSVACFRNHGRIFSDAMTRTTDRIHSVVRSRATRNSRLFCAGFQKPRTLSLFDAAKHSG